MPANTGNIRLIAILSKTDKKLSPSAETREISAGKQAGQLRAPIQTPRVLILSNLKLIRMIRLNILIQTCPIYL
jgi:hypothetical protein